MKNVFAVAFVLSVGVASHAWGVDLSTAGLVSVPGEWTHLPPANLDPKWARTPDTSPRRWSGQKAALRYAEVRAAEKDGEGGIRVDWRAALSATNAPSVPGSAKSLWKGRFPDLPSITSPELYWIGKDLRLFRGAPPDAHELLPACVVEDGNDEDGHGGYLIGLSGAATAFSIASNATEIALSGDGSPFVRRFNGNWLAGMQLLARLHPDWFRAPEEMSPELWISVVAEWMQDAGKWNASAAGWPQFLAERLARRRELLADPRLRTTLDSGLLFITRRQPSWNHEVAQYFGWRQEPGGSVYKLTQPGRSLARQDLIAGRHPAGSYLQPRLSYDAKKLVFAFVATDGGLDPYSVTKVNEEDGDHHYYHLWEMNVDGSGLRQLTKGVYEDFMPEFLPDGDIAFMSSRRRSQSRCFWFGYSNRWQAYTLFRMKSDGSDMLQLSWNDVAEWFPTMSNDGEILFARWDYIDRDAVRHQNLWKMRPDGTNPMAVWGNETMNPHCTFQPRAIPGSRKVVCVASAHHAVTGGPIILIDPAVDENSEAAITHVTPGHYPEIDMPKLDAPAPDVGTWKDHYRDNDWYTSPHPYGEDLFLVAWSRNALHYEPSRKNADAALGLYVLATRKDGGVTRELLWRDGEMSAECPAPLVPRPVPPVWKSQFDPSLQAAQEGEVFISDVNRGLKTVSPGALKEVRVVQIFPRTAPDQYLPNVGCGGHENARGVLGTAKVEADGSARFIVPAKTPILFQVLDAEGRAWRTMRSTTSLMPGERVSCVGCHEPKREASAHAAVVSDAMKKPAQRLVVPPEGGRPWGFVENIQPIFDRKCISCHAGDKAPKGIDLTRAVDPRFSVDVKVTQVGYRQYSAPFTKSYATLVFTDEELPKHTQNKSKKFQWYAPRMGKDADGQSLRMVPNWPEYNHVQTTPEGTAGRSSITSGLMAKLSRGKHGKMLTPEEKRLIATWIDLNATFYGSYEEPDLSKQLKGEPIAFPAVR
ncbi:MAG: hypothetical protein MJ240_10830 [Kiritimatiellae bacterium]|nr:hypothetical protein [Kiritimatiellia bacterium]